MTLLAVPVAKNKLEFSTRIKDAGIAIRHSRGRILFYTAGSRNGLEGVADSGYPFEKNIFFILLRRPGPGDWACEEGIKSQKGCGGTRKNIIILKMWVLTHKPGKNDEK